MSMIYLEKENYFVKVASGEIILNLQDEVSHLKSWRILTPDEAFELGKTLITVAMNVKAEQRNPNGTEI